MSEISGSDIEKIKGGNGRENISDLVGKVWGKIVDWFYGTNREEAKACLFKLYSPTTTHSEKMDSFNRLKNLAADAYKDRFQIHEYHGKSVYTIYFSESGIENFSFAQEKSVASGHVGVTFN